MSNLYSTKQKIAIANSVIEHARGNIINLDYHAQITSLHKIEKKYRKTKAYDLSDFAICFSELPPKHVKLMQTIEWLHPETEAPQKHLEGFYSEIYGNAPGCTQIKHYITVDAYTHLLFIELGIIDLYMEAS
ncbi:MAG: hypothetical protein K0R14_678 [Burkholderiales bacterium]|jgi:hypothetical protein|nr:hypothetical protein [Burkholderiales bacterium]